MVKNNIPGYLERDIVDTTPFWRRPSQPITRVWHGRTRAADADAYLTFLKEKGVLDYLATPGIQDVRIGRSIEGPVAHFYTISTWRDLAAIRAFAGEPVDKARYYPEDERFLLEFEPTVIHYETFPIFTTE
jgi:hypothetical protein